MAGGIDARREAVEGGAGGAEVGDWGERKVLVSQLLRHGANGGADVEMVLVVRIAELREHDGGEVVGGVWNGRRRRLHFNRVHDCRKMRGGGGGLGYWVFRE